MVQYAMYDIHYPSIEKLIRATRISGPLPAKGDVMASCGEEHPCVVVKEDRGFLSAFVSSRLTEEGYAFDQTTTCLIAPKLAPIAAPYYPQIPINKTNDK